MVTGCTRVYAHVHVYVTVTEKVKVKAKVNVNILLVIAKQDLNHSAELGPQAKGVSYLVTPLRRLHVTHRASSCAK